MLKTTRKIKLLLFKAFRGPYKKKLFRSLGVNPEFRILSCILKERALLFVDVGANQGDFVFTASHVIPPSNIIAFEPQPYLAAKLKVLFPGIKIGDLALSSSNGTQTLFVPVIGNLPDHTLASVNKPGDGTLYTSYEVTCSSLDEELKKNGVSSPLFLKIDVEGHEFEVLRGSSSTLSHLTEVLLIELEERHYPGRPIAEMICEIETKGFDAFYFHPRKKLLVLFSQNPEIFQDQAKLNTPFYVNNFWFFAKRLNPELFVTGINNFLNGVKDGY